MEIEKKNEFDEVVAFLLKKGAFAISDIEYSSDLSRESISKKLHTLVEYEILKKTAKRGVNVRYKLAVNDVGIDFIFKYVDQFTIKEIARSWNISSNSAKKYIKRFVDEKILIKVGIPPQKIIYKYNKHSYEHFFTKEQKKIIEKEYAYTTPDGQLLRGINGFVYWVQNKSGRNDVAQMAKEYIDMRKKYYKNKNKIILIDATEKIGKIFNKAYIQKLFHRDFDALPVFGKTYLSQIVRIAKSGRTNIVLMNEIVEKIQYSINQIIDEYKIDCVGFIPPTVSRKTQLMTFLQKKLKTDCKQIKLSKVRSLVPVQQKSLKKIEDRILNASKTIIVSNNVSCKNILLIDDVTGSGATLNEVAKKISQEDSTVKNIYAFTITGSAKAGVFDVISEA